MSAQPNGGAMAAAEEVLRTIYGDDLNGCTVDLESIAAIIEETLGQRIVKDHELLDLYEKLVEALHLLSTPPEQAKLMDADTLRSFLGDRLDAIHTLTTRTIATTAGPIAQRRGELDPSPGDA
jgi:hypothetical protein